MTQYKCAECGAAVECKDVDGTVVFERECTHTEAAIIAELQAVVYGEGGAQ
jgi:hypothetical protein